MSTEITFICDNCGTRKPARVVEEHPDVALFPSPTWRLGIKNYKHFCSAKCSKEFGKSKGEIK